MTIRAKFQAGGVDECDQRFDVYLTEEYAEVAVWHHPEDDGRASSEDVLCSVTMMKGDDPSFEFLFNCPHVTARKSMEELIGAMTLAHFMGRQAGRDEGEENIRARARKWLGI